MYNTVTNIQCESFVLSIMRLNSANLVKNRKGVVLLSSGRGGCRRSSKGIKQTRAWKYYQINWRFSKITSWSKILFFQGFISFLCWFSNQSGVLFYIAQNPPPAAPAGLLNGSLASLEAKGSKAGVVVGESVDTSGALSTDCGVWNSNWYQIDTIACRK